MTAVDICLGSKEKLKNLEALKATVHFVGEQSRFAPSSLPFLYEIAAQLLQIGPFGVAKDGVDLSLVSGLMQAAGLTGEA